MSKAEDRHLLTLQSYITAPYVCGYLSGMAARSQVVVPYQLIDANVYSELVKMGFRRSGMFVYKPACDACDACISIRVRVDAFQPSRSQKKTAKRLAYLEASVVDLRDADEYYALYQEYQKKRHPGGGMDEDKREQYQEFLGCSYVETKVAEYREAADGHALRMISVMDILHDGISAVYTYYDPNNERCSYGTYGILWQIAYAKKLGLPYVYLGYWINGCEKMSYKSNFRPFEILTAQGWQAYSEAI